MGWIEHVNVKVATSVVGKWFRLDGSGHVGPFLFIITFLVLYYSVSGQCVVSHVSPCWMHVPDCGGSNSELRHDITYFPSIHDSSRHAFTLTSILVLTMVFISSLERGKDPISSQNCEPG